MNMRAQGITSGVIFLWAKSMYLRISHAIYECVICCHQTVLTEVYYALSWACSSLSVREGGSFTNGKLHLYSCWQ